MLGHQETTLILAMAGPIIGTMTLYHELYASCTHTTRVLVEEPEPWPEWLCSAGMYSATFSRCICNKNGCGWGAKYCQ